MTIRYYLTEANVLAETTSEKHFSENKLTLIN